MTTTVPTPPTVPATEAVLLADQLERSFRGGAWHGPSLTEALAGVTAAAADRRPVAGAHSLRELVLHVDFWLDEARRRIEGTAIDDSVPGSDWPAGDGAGDAEATWRAALAQLEEHHRRLHAAVLALDEASFDRPVAGSDPSSDPTLRGLLLGLLQHNAYHGGQIVMLAKTLA